MTIGKIKLKDYDTLIRVLYNYNYYTALSIDQSNKNKHAKLADLLEYKVIKDYIIRNFINQL